ncbi:hypothetical protein TWF506_007272 [Arthrobotrys conoides]|uniref:Uncharacterized protein n=1 Tax=Arthrobotrys conoides TaxID=74498 RepID=A0AAN8NA96_9PEZI
MSKPLYSKEMYAPQELNFRPNIKHGTDDCTPAPPQQIPITIKGSRHQSKRKTLTGNPFIQQVKPALHRQPLDSGGSSPVRQAPGAGYITPQRTSDKKQSTRWPGMFRDGTPERESDKSIPPWNAAFENPRKPIVPGEVGDPANLSVNILAEDYKHMVCNPKWGTPKPWRQALERMFDGIALDSTQKEYIRYYSLGYNEGIWPSSALSNLMEQAFLFGVMEKQWDLEVEHGLYRFYHGISDNGILRRTHETPVNSHLNPSNTRLTTTNMMHKTHCKHGIPRGLRCELCDHFTCSLRAPPQGLDFPELLLPPYLPPRDIQPPNYFKSMPSERKVPTETLHNMGVLCRDYSVRIEAANRLAEAEAAATGQIGLTPRRRQQRNSLSRFKILSPLAKLRIVSPEDSPNGGQTSPSRKVKYETKLVSEVFQQKPSVEVLDKGWESSDSGQENENPEAEYEGFEKSHIRPRAKYPHVQVEKARQQGAHLRRIWEENQLEKQRALEEKERQRQEDEARRLELELAAQEHERKRKSLARRRAEKAKLIELTSGAQNRPYGSGLRRVSLARRVPNRRMSRGLFRSRPSMSMNRATPQVGLRTVAPTVTPQVRGTPIFQGPNRRISIRPQTVQKRAQAQADGIAAARSRKLADVAALVKQRKVERMAADQRRKEEAERRVQEARKKVEAEKRRSAEARQRQHEAFMALHRRNKANQMQTQSLTSKVTQKYLAPGNTPRKLYDWQTRRNLKKESANNLFMLTTIGHSRNFSLLPRRMQVNDDFGCLENDIYLPRVPDITTDDLRIWKMNSADIDITQGSFQDLEAHIALAPRIETTITPPWADRARRMASKLPEHLYYGWRICHNYGYFGWKVPKRTTRYFLQARRFGELDREWDEAIARSEAKTQATLEKIGKQESIPMIRIASGY